MQWLSGAQDQQTEQKARRVSPLPYIIINYYNVCINAIYSVQLGLLINLKLIFALY